MGRIRLDHNRVLIKGGFFWMPTQTAAIEQLYVKEPHLPPVDIRGCVFFEKPQWWQLGKWLRAIRLFVGLPK